MQISPPFRNEQLPFRSHPLGGMKKNVLDVINKRIDFAFNKFVNYEYVSYRYLKIGDTKDRSNEKYWSLYDTGENIEDIGLIRNYIETGKLLNSKQCMKKKKHFKKKFLRCNSMALEFFSMLYRNL